MINNEARIQSILSNIIDKVIIIQNDLNENGKTHSDYILEKLEGAQWDLNVVINIAKKVKENEK